MFIRSSSIAVLTTVLAISSVAGASALAPKHTGSSSHAKATKTVVSSAKSTSGHTVHPAKVSVPNISAMEAFPTGGKGSATEQTCRLWTTQLNVDADTLDGATDKDDIVEATTALNQDVSDAESAGCAVIF